MAKAEHMIGRPGRVGVVLGNPKVGLVDMVQQPVEHVRRFAHRRGNDPSMERTVTAGDVRVDHRAGVDAIYFALTEPPAPARPPARKYCPSEDEVVRRALGPARATPPAGPSTRGRHGRRVEELDDTKRREIAESVVSGRKSGAEMARLYGVSQPTVSRIVAIHFAGRAQRAVLNKSASDP